MFGRYRLEELLGRGGMGEVHRAYDTVKDRTVALKRLRGDVAADADFVARFRREAQVASRLTEPHIIPIHDFGEIDGRLFIDMRLVEGTDLAVELDTHGALEPRRAANVVCQVAAALHAAHAQGLVHRDIKPANILLVGPDDRRQRSEAGEFVYVADFGIARNTSATALTTTGAAVGTLDYMAPERFTTGHGDHRVDIYSLGCLFYETLTGQPPFRVEGLPALIHAHLNSPPPAPSQNRPDLPPAIDAVVARAMAKDPDDRYPSANEFAEAVRGSLRDGPPPTEAKRVPAPTTPAHRVSPPTHQAPATAVGSPWAGAPGLPPPPDSPPVPMPPPSRPHPRPRRAMIVVAVAAVLAVIGGGYALITNLGPGGSDFPSASRPLTPARPPQLSASIALPMEPSSITLSPDGRTGYIPGHGGLAIVDLPGGAVRQVISAGIGPGALIMAISPDGRLGYVTHYTNGSVPVTVVDLSTGEVTATIDVGGPQWDAKVSPDGRRLYVTLRGTGTLSVIDTATNTVTATVRVADSTTDSPVEVSLTPDGRRAYLTNRGSSSVTVLDTATNSVLATIGVQLGPNGVTVSPDGRRAYVTNEGSRSVSVIDVATDTVTATLPVGDAPINTAFTPDSTRAFVVNRGSKSVSVIDAATTAVIAVLRTGGDPGAIAMAPDGRTTYLTGGNSNLLFTIDTGLG
jgi:serine/threonine-protein kinase